MAGSNAAYKIILFVISMGALYFDAIFPLASNYFQTSIESLKTLQRYTARMIVSGLEGAMLVARPYGDTNRFESAAARLLAGLTDTTRARRRKPASLA